MAPSSTNTDWCGDKKKATENRTIAKRGMRRQIFLERELVCRWMHPLFFTLSLSLVPSFRPPVSLPLGPVNLWIPFLSWPLLFIFLFPLPPYHPSSLPSRSLFFLCSPLSAESNTDSRGVGGDDQ